MKRFWEDTFICICLTLVLAFFIMGLG